MYTSELCDRESENFSKDFFGFQIKSDLCSKSLKNMFKMFFVCERNRNLHEVYTQPLLILHPEIDILEKGLL